MSMTRLRHKETGEEVVKDLTEELNWYDEPRGWGGGGFFYSNDDWEEVISA